MRIAAQTPHLLPLISGAMALSAVFAAAPVVQKNLVADGGAGLVNDGIALYDPSRYAIRRSEALMDLAVSSDDPVLLFDAFDLAAEAMEAAPGDAFAWTALAWSLANLGEDDAARGALNVSRALAPYNEALAVRRLLLTRIEEPRDDIERDGVARDLITARRWIRDLQFDDLIARSPMFAQLAREEGLIE